MIRKEKQQSWERKCQEVEMYIGGTKTSEIWKFIKQVKSPQMEKVRIQSISVSKWEDYFRTLLNEGRSDFLGTTEREKISPAREITVTEDRVKRCIKEMKGGKAPGPGEIPSELIKNGTPKLVRMMTKLINSCINKGDIPEDWKMAYITPIYKKGRKDICENYRGIAVTNTFSKVYGRMLRELIEEGYKEYEEEEQSGFRAGRSCIDNLFCLSQVMQKKWQTGRELHMVFLDLAKAYDSVPVIKLWEVMNESNINKILINAVKELYIDQKGKVKVGKQMTKAFPISKGLRQGCCLSPTLFKIYVNAVLQVWKRKCAGMGIPLDDNITLYTLQFADDQVLMAQDQEDIEYMTRKIKQDYEKWGLSLNLEKTVYWTLGSTHDVLTMETGEIIRTAEDIKYLGTTIGKQGFYEKECETRIIKGRKILGALNPVIWDPNISRKTKFRIYKSMIESVALYGAEIWQLPEQQKRKLRALEMDFLRRAAAISRMEKIRNERVKEIMNLHHDIIEEIEKKQLTWFGHVQRMEEKRLPKRSLEWQPSERRKRGRPRPGWNDQIRKTIEKWKLPPDAWKNREDWRRRLGAGRPK